MADPNFFRSAGVATPGILDPRTVLTDPKASYPFFLKPACGISSDGATRIDSRRELEFSLGCIPDPVLQEFVAGQEYTLDILADFAGRVRCVVPRLRIETRAGEISKGMTVKNQCADQGRQRGRRGSPRCSRLYYGPVFHDFSRGDSVHRDQSSFRRRFPPPAQAGADFPRWIIEMMLGRDPQIALDGWTDGLLMLRFDDAVFVPRQNVYNDLTRIPYAI